LGVVDTAQPERLSPSKGYSDLTSRNDVTIEPASSRRVYLSFREYMHKRLAPYWLSTPAMSLAS